MERLRISAENFWGGFQLAGSLFDLALRETFAVEIVEPHEADLVFESHFRPLPPPGIDHEPLMKTVMRRVRGRLQRAPRPAFLARSPSAKRIFFSGEPWHLPVGTYDGVISAEFIRSPEYYRLPLWVLYCNFFDNACVSSLLAPSEAGFDFAAVTKLHAPLSRQRFGCSIFSNPHHLRFKAAECLRRHGEVDLFGRGLSRPVADKMALMCNYRYNICFESTIIPGYFTEKALQAKVAGCIPLWYGDPGYRMDFNEQALVNAYEYGFDFDRIMDEVDFRQVAETPLISEVPTHFFTGLVSFLEKTVRDASGSKF